MYRISYTLPDYGYSKIIANCITGLYTRDQEFVYEWNLDSLLNGDPSAVMTLHLKEQGHIPSFISRWDHHLADVFASFQKSEGLLKTLHPDSSERSDALLQLKGRHDWFLDILEEYLHELDVFLWLKCRLGVLKSGTAEFEAARVNRINEVLREMVNFNVNRDEYQRVEHSICNKVYVGVDLKLRWADLGIPSC